MLLASIQRADTQVLGLYHLPIHNSISVYNRLFVTMGERRGMRAGW